MLALWDTDYNIQLKSVKIIILKFGLSLIFIGTQLYIDSLDYPFALFKEKLKYKLSMKIHQESVPED